MSYDLNTPINSPNKKDVSTGAPQRLVSPRLQGGMPQDMGDDKIDDEDKVDSQLQSDPYLGAEKSLSPAFDFGDNFPINYAQAPSDILGFADKAPSDIVVDEKNASSIFADKAPSDAGDGDSEDNIDVTFEDLRAVQPILEAKEQPGDPIRVPYDEGSQIVDLFSLIVEINVNNPGQFKESQVNEAYLRKNKKSIVNQLKQKAKSDSFSWPIENISNKPFARDNKISISATSKYFAPVDSIDSPLIADFDAFALLGKPIITYKGNQAVLQWPKKKELTIKLTKDYRELLKNYEETEPEENSPQPAPTVETEPEENSPEPVPTVKKRKIVEKSTATNDVSTSTKPNELSPVNKDIRDKYEAEIQAKIAQNKAVMKSLGLGNPDLGAAAEKEEAKEPAPVSTRNPRKSRSNNDDDEDEDEESNEDTDSDEEFDEDDDDDDDEKEKKVTRSKKPKEKSEKKAKAQDSFVSLDNISLDARAKKIISDFLNSDNTPTLKFSNLSSAVRSAQQSGATLAPVAAQSSSTTSRPSSAQLAAQNSSSTSRKSVTTISEPQKEKTQNPAKTVDFSNMDERQRNISLCEQRSDVSVQRLAEQLNIPILNSQLQVKSKRQLCAEINAKQEARQQL